MSISAPSMFAQIYPFPQAAGFNLKPLTDGMTYADRIEADKMTQHFSGQERRIFIELALQLIDENSSSGEILQLIHELFFAYKNARIFSQHN